MLDRKRAPLGATFAPGWNRPWFRYLDGEHGAPGNGETPPSTPPAAQTPPAPAVAATTPPPGEPPAVDAASEAQIRALIAERDALADKAAKFDKAEEAKLSELERERLGREKAEQAAAEAAAERLQLQAAVDNGITKDERVLLTATSEAELATQVKAILSMRAPGTASAQAAGITGGGAAPSTKPATLEAAIEAAFQAKK